MNGWRNRETWLINVWYSPETAEDVEAAKELMETQYDEMPAGPLKDMICFGCVDWSEIKEAMEQ